MTKLEYLLMYQQADLKKQELENTYKNTESRQKMARLHKLLKEQQANIQKLTEDAESLQLNLMRLISQQEKLTHDLDLNAAELANLEKDEECTAEEMTELRQDVDGLSRELSKAEKDVKSLLEQLDEAADKFQKTRSVAGKAKKDYDQVKSVCELEKADFASAIVSYDKELSRIELQVDPKFLEKYRRARSHHSQPVVKIINGKCSGCNMSLPMSVLKNIAGQDNIAECENCGRILFQD